MSAFFSVGQNTSDHKTGSPTFTTSGGIATFSVAQTHAQMGVGDRVTFNSTENKFYISYKYSDTQWGLVDQYGVDAYDIATPQTVDSIAHEYTSLSAAEAGASDINHLNTLDLTSISKNLYLPCYYDSAADSTAVTVNGWTTSAAYHLYIYTPMPEVGECNTSQRHTGKEGTGYRLLVSSDWDWILSIRDDYTRVEGLVIANIGAGGQNPCMVIYGCGQCVVMNNIIYATTATTDQGYTYLFRIASVTTSTKNYVINNIIYGKTRYFGAIFYSGDWNSATVVAYGNTVISLGNGSYPTMHFDGSNVYAKNNLLQGSTLKDWNCTNGVLNSATNITKDATSPEVALRSKTISFVSAGSDYHLAESDTIAANAGTTCVDDPFGQYGYGTDIDMTIRPPLWDIGADQRFKPVFRRRMEDE